MGDLRVGDDNCTYHTVAETMTDGFSLHNELHRVAGALKVEPPFNPAATLVLNLGTTQELYTKVLQNWRMSVGNDATLGALIHVLRGLELNGPADKLSDKFGVAQIT